MPSIAIDEDRLGHIFREAEGHFREDSDVNRRICADSGVTYVTPPEEALDDRGYLLPMAWNGATHASAWYGALALDKIASVVADRRALSHV